MFELNNALNYRIDQRLAEKYLKRFQKQVEKWQISLPKVKPLVLDFGLKNFEKYGLIEYWIANEIDAGYCAKYLFVFDNQTCPKHFHKNKKETFFVTNGRIKVNYGESVLELNAGESLVVECNRPHSFTGIGYSLILEVSQTCIVDDNYFENQDIPIGGNFKFKSVS